MYYAEAISYLYSLQKYGIKLGLQNIGWICALLDNPETALNTIHIAGTNGKGTTAKAMQSILSASGYKTGLFVSPHMVRFNERITIDGSEISEDDVVNLTGEILEALKERPDIQPTFFEFVTAMAFLYFRNMGCDWAVLETGMGGRFDSTNVVTPAVSIITTIGEDHKQFLGDTIEKIAFEKAGIIKTGVPVIVLPQRTEALAVIKNVCSEKQSPMYIYGEGFDVKSVKCTPDGTIFDYHGKSAIDALSIPVVGAHQAANVSSAVRAWELIIESGKISGSEELLRSSLKQMTWHGRCELTIIKGIHFLFDGAHNPEALTMLSETICRVYLKSGNPNSSYGRIILVFAAMSDKDCSRMVNEIVPAADEVIFTALSYGRAEKPESLLSEVKWKFTDKSFHIATTVADALKKAINLYNPGTLIVVAGSFYLLGEAKEILGEKSVLRSLSESV
ncbi:MAG: bifunctional folylpolyglutamate synthase/dihydrofolate synthase [Nitrospirae bacterium]|nr:bifunctional folylpolyglutamate synthase/dihydrofolate synthase [Nitrospirota bacterium]MBF0535130.1 bifunctional folylpolyglutamate synthase/dihydrofolate synthase [Nitrospirota bacterium]MBF0615320.1 bifunctional folylpolyglutamate synthase/dihydrofolate synthase [Nitrospirota bacterium]